MRDKLISTYNRVDADLTYLTGSWPFLEEGLLPSTPIMRFIKLDYAVAMLGNMSNTLARVTSWKDNYEGIMRAFQYKSNCLQSFWNSYYGQSWTLGKYDSELLWNARSPRQDSVCLKSTIGKLIKSVLRISDVEKVMTTSAIGRVSYDDEMMQSFLRRISSGELPINEAILNSDTIMEWHFMKRPPFADEKEFRLIIDGVAFPGCVRTSTDFVNNGSLVSYRVEPDDFLVEILLDPRIDASSINCDLAKMQCLVAKNGWRCDGRHIVVRQSPLYEPVGCLIDADLPIRWGTVDK